MGELLFGGHDASRSKLAGMPVSVTSKRQAAAIFYSEIGNKSLKQWPH